MTYSVTVNSDNLRYVLRSSFEQPLPRTRPRELVLPAGTRKVVGLVGPRRAGKTFLFFEAMRKLVDRGVPRTHIVYLNFEDDRLHPVHAAELDLILRSLRELFPATIGARVHLFLDEVQNVPGWERWVRRVHDTEDAEVYVTGSSSSLLTRNLSTALRGRSVALEVFPLSFREYLAFRGIELQASSDRSESAARAALDTYLRWGGFPEIVLAEEAMRPLILEEYASVMLYRDLVERYSVRNEKLMRELLRHCYRNTASLLAVTKLHRDLRSLGYNASKNTLFEFLRHLEDSLLVFLLPKQERSLRKQAHNPKKLHVVDPGLVAGFLADPGRDLGHKLETTVFLEMRRRHKDLHYWVNGGEVDLCDDAGTFFVNTTLRLTDAATAERERAAMALGKKRWPRAEGRLVYHEYTPALTRPIPGAVAAWRFLTERPGL